jgi:hypothetical protein
MRWKIGDFDGYEFKYNPKSDNKGWSANEGTIMNMNGNISNPNLFYKGIQRFSIDLYDKPTSVSKTYKVSGSYISLSEHYFTSKLYLLKNNGTFEVKNSDGGVTVVKTVTGTASVTLPSSIYPLSITCMNGELAFLYRSASDVTILITDENGLAIRKYIYNTASGDVSLSESICWDFGTTIYILNPYGKIYSLNGSTLTFLYEFPDYTTNKDALNKKYTGIMPTIKNGQMFLGILENKKDIIFLDNAMKVSCKVGTGMSNIAGVSHSNTSKGYYIIVGTKVLQLFPNICRLDLKIIKEIIAKGQVTAFDELGFPSILSVTDMSITRHKNMHEARYEVEFNAEIVVNNQTQNDLWKR